MVTRITSLVKNALSKSFDKTFHGRKGWFCASLSSKREAFESSIELSGIIQHQKLCDQDRKNKIINIGAGNTLLYPEMTEESLINSISSKNIN